MSSGKANAADVVDDAVRTMKRKAEALKKTSANPEVVAAADAAVADLTKKAEATKKALAAGKTDAGHAIDDTLASVAQAAESLNHSSQSAGVGEAVKSMTGACVRRAAERWVACLAALLAVGWVWACVGLACLPFRALLLAPAPGGGAC